MLESIHRQPVRSHKLTIPPHIIPVVVLCMQRLSLTEVGHDWADVLDTWLSCGVAAAVVSIP